MKNAKGFTLVESAIVIVVIALVVGGIFAGRELIASSKQTSLLSQVRELQASYNSFVLKYNGPPGDLVNASAYFGAANVRNGDGNGRIVYKGHESYNAFRELNLSGLYQKTTTNWDPNYTYYPTANVHEPECKYYKKCMLSLADAGYSSTTYSDTYGRPQVNAIIMEGTRRNGSIDRTGYKRGILTPAQAAAMDSKVDDGGGHSGAVQAYSVHTLCGADNVQYLDCDDNYYYNSYNDTNGKRWINLYWKLDN